ncbi:COG3781 Predicted membrane protein [Spirosomataceae bacterium]|jgi:putative membrane protein
MVSYNPKDWWKLIFDFHKSDTFRQLLPGILGVALFTALVAFLENDYFNATFKNTTVIHSLVGFVLSMLLVFRTNSAYDRWWEGRKLWGAMVNNTRSLMLKIIEIDGDSAIKDEIRILLVDFVYATKEHLRNGVMVKCLHQKTIDLLPQEQDHIPLAIMNVIHHKVSILLHNQADKYTKMVYLNDDLKSFMDILGGCERIKKTPIPFSYSLFLKKVIFLYIFTMPIGFVREFGYWACPIVALIFYVFAGIELLAEEIEDPFGTDANDLPTDTIFNTIKQNLDQIV